jgi:hypothetical protein
VIFGFGGLQLNDAGISQLKTKLPQGWKSLEIKGVGAGERTFRN